ncbi:MAG: DNA polymerase III subunit alpha [Albidovulum sp.]|nr:DNA polymerase III subunit alpha [Albidovulum sp.]
MDSQPRFVHLRLHSEYSLLEGAVRVGTIPELCARHGMPAVAVTDTGNMFCAIEFATKAAEKGIQPIPGMQASFRFEGFKPKNNLGGLPQIVLLGQNEEGYRNLLKLNSCMYTSLEVEICNIRIEDLEACSEGVICLTGGSTGPLGYLIAAGQFEEAGELALRLARIFPDRLYVEIQRHADSSGNRIELEKTTERGMVEIAYRNDLPLVATNDTFFPEESDFGWHDVLICIGEKSCVDQETDRRRLSPTHCFRSQDEMCDLFADIPEAIENTLEIARRCSFFPKMKAPILPKFAEDEIVELRRQAEAGLKERFAKIELAAPEEEYWKRLEFELETIEKMGFPGYFLIVAEFVKWAKGRDIPVGPGRGSGAGSLVAYSLTITDLDPIRYSLLFERFLNPERVSMPDFDIDFCMDRRDEVIRHIQQTYGSDRVAQIITYGTLKSKAAVRDVGRVLQQPYSKVDRLAKLLPREGAVNVPIAAARKEPALAKEESEDPSVNILLDHAQSIEGLLRNASTHAGGVVIGDRPLEELVPLYRDARSDMPVTQFDMKWVEAAGLVKFDILGSKTLTVIHNAVKLIEKSGERIDITAIPLDDKKTFELYGSAATDAVFQVESAGMKDALRRMNPTCLEDIVALVALYRPGPMENIPDYCDVKNGKSKRKKLHPKIDHVLDETQGIIVYQEQVMQIAQLLAGYSLGGADLLRRAMGKKIKSAMDAERPNFLKGSEKNGVPKSKANSIWELLAKFADYGFNKSHAAVYALVSYQTAWLKAHHPVEFMAAVMNCDIGDTDKLYHYAKEVNRLGIDLLRPCVNRSTSHFAADSGKISYALGGLKNVGIEAVKAIEVARGDKPFVSLFDFASRVDLKSIGKRSLEILAKAGGFEELNDNRRAVLASLDTLISYSATIKNERESAQMSLFGDMEAELEPPPLPAPKPWSDEEKYREEATAIGFYLSGHPLEAYSQLLSSMGILDYRQITEAAVNNQGSETSGQIAATISNIQRRKSGKGNAYAFLQLSDATADYEAVMYSEALDACESVLEIGRHAIFTVNVKEESGQIRLFALRAEAIPERSDARVNNFRIFIDDSKAPEHVKRILERVQSLREPAARNRGAILFSPVDSELNCDVDIAIPGEFRTDKEVRRALAGVHGVVKVEEFAGATSA